MQLASHGLRGLPGQAASRWLSTGGPSTRSIHIPSIPRTTHTTPPGLAHKLLSTTRSLLSGFVGHLTTPGTLRGAHGVPSRSLHSARPQTIQQRLSLPSRYALSTPLHAPRLPKPPVVPRSTTQVGLGAARNFSTARPIFQNLVQNVPIAGRSLYEADWEIRMPELEKAKMGKAKEMKEVKKGKEMMKPKQKKERKDKAAKKGEELERYFPAPSVEDVVTYLYVPLAPTPTSRMPLQASGAPSRFLPLDTLASLHNGHELHSLRVSSLFMRLDQAKVWERGASTSAYGDPSGVCAVLKVEFKGWTESMVRGVIGESGSGWCEIEEVRRGEEDEMDSVLSDMEISEVTETESEDEIRHPFEQPHMDPSQSFVLPTLDFSSSFYAASRQSVAPPLTPLFSDFSDAGSERSFSSGSFVHASRPNDSSWYGLGEEPRESMF
ncbi:hypothetical protein OE88DRAFT_1715004 [Heliocybe sulcata]|uniref:Uncharacterized protein n=1 Tax=Heliocybe sulcata TaxID=5364 RepID=A0A5C3MLU3_9AGAM|nr:hypothetical protein OE88DRAFT_1715004 [Heliocybe sulcata]